MLLLTGNQELGYYSVKPLYEKYGDDKILHISIPRDDNYEFSNKRIDELFVDKDVRLLVIAMA